MLKALDMRRVNAIALIALTLLLAGCDDPMATVRSVISQVAKFLSGESRQATNRTPKGCPDVQGSFAVMTPTSAGGQYDLLSTFLGRGVHHSSGNRWRSVTIEGDASKALQLTYARPEQRDLKKQSPNGASLPAYIRYALETPHGVLIERYTTVLRPDVNYGCKNGWLTAEKGNSSIRIRRDAAGNLEGQMTDRTARVIPLWAETGAGIPYWFDSKTHTVRWAAMSPAAAMASGSPPVTGSSPPSRPSGGIARQEWDLTYGGAGVAPSTPRADKPYDAQKEIRALVDRNAKVESIRSEAGRYVLNLRVESRGPVTRTIENLRMDARLRDVQDHGVISGGSRPDIATISVQVVAPR